MYVYVPFIHNHVTSPNAASLEESTRTPPPPPPPPRRLAELESENPPFNPFFAARAPGEEPAAGRAGGREPLRAETRTAYSALRRDIYIAPHRDIYIAPHKARTHRADAPPAGKGGHSATPPSPWVGRG